MRSDTASGESVGADIAAEGNNSEETTEARESCLVNVMEVDEFRE